MVARERDIYAGEYLTITAGEALLQARVTESSVRQLKDLTKKPLSLDLVEGSANGTVVFPSEGKTVVRAVANGSLLCPTVPITSVEFIPPQTGESNGKSWIVMLKTENPPCELIIDEPTVILGSPTSLKQKGQVIFEAGQLKSPNTHPKL